MGGWNSFSEHPVKEFLRFGVATTGAGFETKVTTLGEENVVGSDGVDRKHAVN